MRVLCLALVVGLASGVEEFEYGALEVSNGTNQNFWIENGGMVKSVDGSRGQGREFKYEYTGMISTGIPELDEQYAGYSIHCNVYLQQFNSQEFKLGLENVSFARFNKKMDPPIRPAFGDYKPFNLESLIMPVKFTMVEGEVVQVWMSSHETHWTGKTKLAILDLLKTQYAIHHHSSQKNLLENQLKVMEDGVDGNCENTYSMMEITPEAVTDIKMKQDICMDKKLFHINKIRNVDQCQKSTMYVSRRGMEKINLARTSRTKFLGCGENSSNILIFSGTHEGGIIQKMFNSESTVTKIQQTLHLTEINNKPKDLGAILDIEDVTNISSKLPIKSNNIKQHLFAGSFASVKPAGDWEDQRALYMDKIGGIYKIKKSVLYLLEDIESKLFNNVERVAENQISSKLMSVVQMLGLVTREELGIIHSYLKEKQCSPEVRQLFMDAVTMTGTSHSADFLRQLIVDGNLDDVNILMTVLTFGNYVRKPTIEILNHFFDIVRAPSINKNRLTRNNAILNFANLINKGCIDNDEDTMNNDMFGHFCSSSTLEITNIYIPYMIECLKLATATDDEEYRETLIHALGITGHESLIPHLLSIIKGVIFADDLPLRVMTVFALRSVTKKHRNVLVPAYISILDNPKEHRNVKIAVLSMILISQPSLPIMQKLALSTWKAFPSKKIDEELSRFIFFTLKSLNEQDLDKVGHDDDLYRAIKMAKIVFPLVKPFPGMIFYSSSHFVNEYLKNLYDGYRTDTTFTFSEDGNFIFHKMILLVDKLKLPALELAISLKGEKSVMKQLQDLAYSMAFNSTLEKDKFPIHPDWKTNIEDLKIKIREVIPFHTVLNLNIMDSIYFKLGANQLTLDSFVSKFDNIMKDPLKGIQEGLCNQRFNISFVKAFNVLPIEIIQTSALGLPIITEIQAPQIISLQGHVRIFNCEPENPANLQSLPNLGLKLLAISPSVELVLHFKYIGEFYGYTEVMIPFTSEVAVAATTEHRSINLPTIETIFDWTVNSTTNSLSLKFRSLESNATAVDVLHYGIRPFTGIQKVTEFTPLKLHAENKIIHSKQTTKTVLEKNINNNLGLNLILFAQSDSTFLGKQSFLDKLLFYKNRPDSLFLFPFLFSNGVKNGMPSSQFQEFSLVYSPKDSQLQEVIFDHSMVYGWAYRDIKDEYGNIMSKQRNINWKPEDALLLWEFKDQDIGHYDDWWRKYREGGYKGSADTTPLQKKIFHAMQWELDDPIEQYWGKQNDTNKVDWNLNLPFIFWRRGVYFDYKVTLKDDQSVEFKNYSANIMLSIGDQKNKFSPKPLDRGIWFVYYMKKWHMQIEWLPKSDEQFNICMTGRLQKPRHFSQWNPDEWFLKHFIGYMYEQKIAYGRTCEDNKADLWLIPHVSKMQREVAKTMPEGAICAAAREQVGKDKAWNGSFVFHTNYLHMPECREQIKKAAIMDQLLVYFNFTDLHGDFPIYQQGFEEIARLYLLPYIDAERSSWLGQPLDDGLGRYRLRFRFDSKRHTVDAHIVTAKKEISFLNYTVLENVTQEYLTYNAFFGNKVVYETKFMNVTKQKKITEKEEKKFTAKNIHMPEYLRGIYPLSPLKTQEMNFEQPIEAITGTPLFQTCRVDNRGHVETFKGHNYHYQLDDCWTLLASDCSPELSGAIFARVSRGQDMEIKVYHSQYVWHLNWHHIRWSGPDEIWSQNGRPRYVHDFNVTVWYSKDQSQTRNIYKYQYWCSIDDVCFLELPDFIVIHDGMGLEVRSRRYTSEFHSCGICGDTDKNPNKQVRSGSSCRYDSYPLAAASYRHTTENCTAIHGMENMEKMLQEQEERCEVEEMNQDKLKEMKKLQEDKLFRVFP